MRVHGIADVIHNARESATGHQPLNTANPQVHVIMPTMLSRCCECEDKPNERDEWKPQGVRGGQQLALLVLRARPNWAGLFEMEFHGERARMLDRFHQRSS